ncbi:MAG: hypothetical protein A2X58_14375 [Nitrospirae bacterium GWC2_56_14]|nr:MAG: hypothetical protein A2X58_14375 [Nitrospirae bacterium GWC2_56_14]
MLAILSDLHFQDTMNDIVKDDGGNTLVSVDRNISPKAFKFIFDEFIDIANKVKAQELNIVLAGDIFDLNRSQTWFKGPVRPYGDHSVDEWAPIAKQILGDIITTNSETFELFTHYAGRKLESGAPVTFTYLPGNHDRLINLHPELRLQVRNLLEKSSRDNSPFPHEIALPGYGVHIRHGHEYDQTNFAGTVCSTGPLICDPKDYDAAPMGDFVSIDIVTRIACEYRRRYERDMKAGNTVHTGLYRKILEFDDLRPTSDLIAFIKTEMTDGDGDFEKYFMPVVKDVLNDALKSAFLRKWLSIWTLLKAKAAQCWSYKALLKAITKMDSEQPLPWKFAIREPDLADADTTFRYVVAGHTHNPDLVYLSKNNKGQERFFFDTGTWRQQIRKCTCDDEKTFARAKALTYVLFYSPEKDCCNTERVERFDYWSGYTKTVSDSIPKQ